MRLSDLKNKYIYIYIYICEWYNGLVLHFCICNTAYVIIYMLYISIDMYIYFLPVHFMCKYLHKTVWKPTYNMWKHAGSVSHASAVEYVTLVRSTEARPLTESWLTVLLSTHLSAVQEMLVHSFSRSITTCSSAFILLHLPSVWQTSLLSYHYLLFCPVVDNGVHALIHKSFWGS